MLYLSAFFVDKHHKKVYYLYRGAYLLYLSGYAYKVIFKEEKNKKQLYLFCLYEIIPVILAQGLFLLEKIYSHTRNKKGGSTFMVDPPFKIYS